VLSGIYEVSLSLSFIRATPPPPPFPVSAVAPLKIDYRILLWMIRKLRSFQLFSIQNENKFIFCYCVWNCFAEGSSAGSSIKLTVEPPEYTGPGGETVRLSCLVGEDRALYTIRWSRANGRELPRDSVQSDGVLTIFDASPADSDVYVCTATLRSTGAVAEIQARVTIVSSQWVPQPIAHQLTN
jgi:hypothetical protein